ncbi:MAG: gamma-glutamylcyclotransferase family protein, partial [Stellaceae bacterium]
MRRLAVLLFGVLLLFAAWLADAMGGECNVPPDPNRAQYIVGYGSLMQDESRNRTSPQAGPAHPVEVRGYRRGWFSRPEAVGFSTTFLGARADREGHFNAVLYQVDPAELLATDRRELSYCRADVALPDVKPLEKDLSLERKAQIWIYVSKPESIAPPSARYPIVQSYVDIFVSGCLEQEQRFALAEFAQQCLATTSGWSEHWVNDRLYPRRPFIYQPRARQIDN